MSLSKDLNDAKVQESEREVSLGRHQAQCTVCRHPRRQEIEEAWVGWGYTGQIAEDFGVSRDSIYRHAHATGLFPKREANVKIICEKVLERVDRTPFNASNIVSMFNAYLKLNLAEKRVEAERASDPKVPPSAETQQLDGPIPDGYFVAETESAISREPQGDRDSLNNDQKAAEAAQPADPKPAIEESPAKERDNSAVAGSLVALLDQMPGTEPEHDQNEEKEPQGPEPTAVQPVEAKGCE